MSSTILKTVKFVSSSEDKDFGIAVKKRVAQYFKEKKIPRTGDYRIWMKVIALPLLYLAPFIFLLTNTFSGSLLVFYGLWLLMGVGLAGCGLGIMHDACHGALSKKRWVNDFIGDGVLLLAGGHPLNWKIQHNVLHHSYTNIDGYDEDIDPSGVMRFSPHQPVKPMFKYQVYYAWFLYGLMTFSWATFKDFLQMSRYDKKGLLAAQGTTYKKEFPKLIIEKIIYHLVFIVLPIVLIDVAWYHVILGWFAMHFLAGLILAIVFQPAHCVPSSDFPLPDKENKLKGDWALHQMETTADFAASNRVLSWYVGGLNYQIEHHLFPTMSHVHHRGISKIVEETAKEFNVPYHSEPTFIGALVKHAKMLHKLGKD
ncbi:MAG: acyl-CoA desaturase [Fluviicola sp.]|nr:acyl-CoA desaturase [Fluviicola sp.]